jgi:endonuclease G
MTDRQFLPYSSFMMIQILRMGLFTVILFFTNGVYTIAMPLPAVPSGDRLVQHKSYTIAHNPKHKQADWVSYLMTQHQLRGCVERFNGFKPDPQIPIAESAALSDYAGSGYDRGHMMPAGDNRWDSVSMKESFFLSNMSPQPASFNRGIWKTLENLVRAWALNSTELWVTTGPQLNAIGGSIGAGQVSIPRAYYKALVSKKSNGTFAGIAFLMPATASGSSSQLPGYSMSIAKLEQILKLNFHSTLNSNTQVQIENRVETSAWNFNERFSYLPCSNFSNPKASQPDTLFAFF